MSIANLIFFKLFLNVNDRDHVIASFIIRCQQESMLS